MTTDFERYMSGETLPENCNGFNIASGTVSLIIPVRDAERYVNRMIHFVRQNWKSSWGALEIMIADCNSSDKTFTLAQLDADHVVTAGNIGGLGACLRKAMESARGDFRLVVEPARIKEIDRAPLFLEWLKNDFDLVIGNRFCSGRQNRFHGNILAKITRRIADQTVAPGINDVRSGFKGFTRRSGKKLFGSSIINGPGVDGEILGMALREGMKIKEVPVVEQDSTPVIETLRLNTAIQLIADSIRTKSRWQKTGQKALKV